MKYIINSPIQDFKLIKETSAYYWLLNENTWVSDTGAIVHPLLQISYLENGDNNRAISQVTERTEYANQVKHSEQCLGESA